MGNVWTHTCLVYHVAHKLGAPHISKVIAVLHDIGKPFVRRMDNDGKVWFTGHESVSMFRAIDIIDEFNLTTYEKILALLTIGRHRDMFPYLKDSNMKRSKITSKFVNKDLYNLVYVQTYCDYMGRIFETNYNNVFTLLNELYDGDDSVVNYTHHKKERDCEIVIMVGPTLCGKSTFAKKHYPDHVYLSRDDVVMELAPKGCHNYTEAFQTVDQEMVGNIFNERFREAVNARKNIVVDKTHTSKKSRNQTLSFVNGAYHKKAVVFLTGYKKLLERNQTRFYETGKYIPVHVINKFIASFSLPKYTHFDEIEYVYNDLVFNEMNSSPLYKY